MSDYLAYLDRMARQYGVPAEEARAIYNLETSGGRNVKRSSAGAIGHMQLMPGTARELGVDPNDPLQNIKGGVQYYAQQRRRFGDPALAAAAYNAGPGRVSRAGNQVPNIAETRNYVANFRRQLGQATPSPLPAASASVAPTSAYRGQTTMDETEDSPEGALGAAPTADDWRSLYARSTALQEQQTALRRKQFEQGQQFIQQQYQGPSRAQTLMALSQALLAPRPYGGFAGTLHNVTQGLGGILEKRDAAERNRAEALARLQQSYQTGEMEGAETALDRELQMLQARSAANKPAKLRSGFNPVTGDLVDLDTGLPIKPPPPKVGEVREGYRYTGGDPASQSSWQKVR